jgi:hypothetical protein
MTTGLLLVLDANGMSNIMHCTGSPKFVLRVDEKIRKCEYECVAND